MVSQKLLKEYDLLTIEDWFDSIVASYVNGQPKQVADYIKKLNKSQKLEFHHWLQDENVTLDQRKSLGNLLVEIILD